MAASIRGIQPLKFGTTETEGYVTESVGETDSTQEVLIENEIGDNVTQITGIGKKTDVTIEVIPKSGTDKPEAGEVFEYGEKSLVILTIDSKEVKKDVMKWTIKGNRFPDIDLS